MYGECDFQACKACMRQYLLGTNGEPHCMSCKRVWTKNFMVMNLNRSFVDQPYTKHYTDMLIEREISRLPETMVAAEAVKRSFTMAEAETEKAKMIEKEIRDITSIEDIPAEELERIRRINPYCIDSVIIEYHIRDKQRESKYHRAIANRHRRNLFRPQNIPDDKVVEKRKFIMPCPGEDCRGFLSSQYKCELCSTHTCPKCLEIIGKDKTSEHTCNEDNVKSAELIKKDTKPCPSCGTRIFKISGCDQMWCVGCHQAFSWKTGKIETGTIHNPHFYEHKRNTNNGMIPRAPGDILCGGLCDMFDLSNIIKKMNARTLKVGDKVNHAIYHKNNVIEYVPARVIGELLPESHGDQTIVLIQYEHVRDYDKPCLHCKGACPWNSNKMKTSGKLNGEELVKRKFITLPECDEVSNIHRMISHITHVNLENARRDGADERYEQDKQTLRIRYILGHITKDKLGKETYKIEKKRQKYIELLHIYELLNVVGVEMFANMTQSTKTCNDFYNEVIAHRDQFRTLCDYCNEKLCEISVSYNTTVMKIYKNWETGTHKASLREARRATK